MLHAELTERLVELSSAYYDERMAHWISTRTCAEELRVLEAEAEGRWEQGMWDRSGGLVTTVDAVRHSSQRAGGTEDPLAIGAARAEVVRLHPERSSARARSLESPVSTAQGATPSTSHAAGETAANRVAAAEELAARAAQELQAMAAAHDTLANAAEQSQAAVEEARARAAEAEQHVVAVEEAATITTVRQEQIIADLRLQLEEVTAEATRATAKSNDLSRRLSEALSEAQDAGRVALAAQAAATEAEQKLAAAEAEVQVAKAERTAAVIELDRTRTEVTSGAARGAGDARGVAALAADVLPLTHAVAACAADAEALAARVEAALAAGAETAQSVERADVRTAALEADLRALEETLAANEGGARAVREAMSERMAALEEELNASAQEVESGRRWVLAIAAAVDELAVRAKATITSADALDVEVRASRSRRAHQLAEMVALVGELRDRLVAAEAAKGALTRHGPEESLDAEAPHGLTWTAAAAAAVSVVLPAELMGS